MLWRLLIGDARQALQGRRALHQLRTVICRAVPINEHPRRIAHQPSTATFGVITLSAAKDRAFVRVFSQATWEEVASLQLDTNEIANAITSIPHPDDSTAEVRSCFTL